MNQQSSQQTKLQKVQSPQEALFLQTFGHHLCLLCLFEFPLSNSEQITARSYFHVSEAVLSSSCSQNTPGLHQPDAAREAASCSQEDPLLWLFAEKSLNF